MRNIRVISLDITGTLLVHKYPIMQTYIAAAHWAKLPNPPERPELELAYKKAYKLHSHKYPHFGATSGISARQWWKITAKSAFELCGRSSYTDREFDRFFRHVYQYYGTPDAYEILPDVLPFLKWSSSQKNEDGTSRFVFGITSNTPMRTIDTILPIMKVHEYFQWFVCSEEVRHEKPSHQIFDEALSLSRDYLPNLQPNEILHIGDSLAADFCGAKASGFESIFLDRSENKKVVVYQDWLNCGNYPGKSEEDVLRHTVKDLEGVRRMLEA